VIGGAVSLFAVSRQPAPVLSYTGEARVAMPPHGVWEKLRDLSVAHHYVPGVVSTEVMGERREGVDTRRRVYSSDTDYLVETVTRWQPGRGFTLQVQTQDGGAPAPFSDTAFEYMLSADGEGSTRIVTKLNVRMRGGAVGGWLGETLISGAMNKRCQEVADGLARYLAEFSVQEE
jgi:carbon monoxide dehydrogenase subunit G